MRSSASVIVTDLLQDGAISAGALIVLLIPITWYGSVVRRRDRQLQAAGRRPASSGDDGRGDDPLREYFGPQPATPAAEAPVRPEPRFQARPALTGRSTLSSAFAARPLLPAPAAAGSSEPAPGYAFGAGRREQELRTAAGPPQTTPPRTAPSRTTPPRPASAYQSGTAAGGASDAWTSGDSGNGFTGSGSATGGARTGDAGVGTGGASAGQAGSGGPGGTAPTLRHAPVSGAPPWGPAPRPTSELPWAQVPGPPEAGGSAAPGALGAMGSSAPVGQPGAGPQPGTRPQWPVRPPERAPAPRSIFDPEPGSPALPESEGGWRQLTDSGSRPIYTWNPEGESA